MRKLGIDNYADFINWALTLYEWVVNEKRKENSIEFINETLGTINEYDTDGIIPAQPGRRRDDITRQRRKDSKE
jgi:hypothetical protein